MSLDAALYELAGAGLVACATGLGIAVPAGAVRGGDAFIGFTSQRGAWGEINRVVEELKREIMDDARARHAGESEIVSSIGEAVACMEQFRPDPEALREALTSAVPPSSPIDPAARIAGDIIARAAAAHPPHLHVATPAQPAAGPSLGAQKLLHLLLARLLRQPALISGLSPMFQDYLAMTAQPVAQPVSTPSHAPARQSMAQPVAAAPAAPAQHGQMPRLLSIPEAPPAALSFPGAMPPASPLGNALRSMSPIGAATAPVIPLTRDGADGGPDLALTQRLGVSAAYARALSAAGIVGQLDKVQASRSLSAGAFRRFLATLEQQSCPAGAAPLRLDEMAVWLGNLIAALTKPSNEDADTRRLKAEAARLLAEGDLEGAMRGLKNVRRTLREGRRRIEERLREDILLLHQQMAGEAGVIARQAEMELTRRDYASAAELFAEARDSLPSSEVQSAWLYAMRQGEALFRLGDEFDDARALGEAVRAYAACLAMTRVDEAPRNWIAAQCGIALAHLRLAERSLDAEALDRSIEAWRAALAALTTLEPRDAGQEHVARRHLARALALLGERESGAQALEESATLYRAIAAALDAATYSIDWAEAQAGLAGALLLIDERQESAGGNAAALTEALSALDAALTVYSAATSPAEWSSACLNKGNVLLSLGDRERDVARYAAAAACFEQAATVQSREQSPGNWALIQTSLANAHAAIGEQTRDARRLELAAAAYRQALDVLHGPADEVRRAIAELNLGTVLARLAFFSDAQRHRLEAMTVMLSALETFKARQAHAYVAIAERNLRNLHAASREAFEAKAS